MKLADSNHDFTQNGGITVPGTMKRVLWGLTAVFVLYGISRVFTYSVDLTMGLSQFFWGVVVLIWAASVWKRVTDRRLRTLLLAVCALLLVYMLMQLLRYDILCNFFTVRRWLWYGFYVPMLDVPLLCLAIALLVHRPKGSPLPRWFWILAGIGGLLVLGVLTNDLHFQFVRFPTGVLNDNGDEKNGWLNYAANGFQYGAYLVFFAILIRKSRSLRRQKYRWIPLLPLALAIGYFLLYPTHLDFRWFGFRLYNMGEMLVFCLICALEACIQTGMIPANTNYEVPHALQSIDRR